MKTPQPIRGHPMGTPFPNPVIYEMTSKAMPKNHNLGIVSSGICHMDFPVLFGRNRQRQLVRPQKRGDFRDFHPESSKQKRGVVFRPPLIDDEFFRGARTSSATTPFPAGRGQTILLTSQSLGFFPDLSPA